MLAHPQLQIPKYMGDYSPHHVDLDRPKSLPSQTYYADISSIVSASLSPVRSDSPGDNPIDDPTLPSPTSPQENAGNFPIVSQRVTSLDSNLLPSESYNNSNTSAYNPHAHHYSSASSARTSGFIINSSSGLRNPDGSGHYLSDSPSPIDVQQVPSSSHPSSAPPSQYRFPHMLQPPYTGVDRTITGASSNSGRCSRIGQMDKYSGSPLDQRRMSEPALLSDPHAYHADINTAGRQSSSNFACGVPDATPSRSSASMYLPSSLHRGASTGSLREQHYHYSPPNEWKPADFQRDGSGIFGLHDEPSSPLQSHFGGGMVSPTSGLPYSPLSENFYGPSPPGTGTSTSSSGHLGADGPHPFPKLSVSQRTVSGSANSDADRKNYSFIALPGNAVKKRPRRRYDEIERLYRCSWPDCTKAYGTLNHLNAHVTMQKHGPKRSPSEFKDLRKQWRAAKKEAESQMALNLRRNSFGGHHDDFDYGSRFAYSHAQRNHPFHQPGVDFQSDDQSIDYDGRRYEEILPPSWQRNSLSSRGLPQAFISTSFPSHHIQHLQQLTIPDIPRHHSVPMPPSPPRTIHQLPPNSTLLTPLPTYHQQSFVSTAHDSIAYSGDGYDFYDDTDRPGTGNASIGPASSDEMQDDRGF